jgi:hypothetical protein
MVAIVGAKTIESEPAKQMDDVCAMAFSPDGRTLAVATAYASEVDLRAPVQWARRPAHLGQLKKNGIFGAVGAECRRFESSRRPTRRHEPLDRGKIMDAVMNTTLYIVLPILMILVLVPCLAAGAYRVLSKVAGLDDRQT